jgi:hypothetical protein
MHPVNAEATQIGLIAGRLDRSVFNIFRIAVERAEQPFGAVRDHLIFFGRNPGMFVFVAEVMVRLGMKDSPIPLQILMLLLNVGGLFLVFQWASELFEDQKAGLFSVAFLVFTPMLLWQSVSIHAGPYNFFFFNLSVVGFLKWLRGSRKQSPFLILSILSYFLCCMNYWFFWIQLGLFLLLIASFEGVKLDRRHYVLLGLAPLGAGLVTLVSIIWNMGSVSAAVFKLGEILVARTVDARLPGSTWYPDRSFLGHGDLLTYPWLVQTRLRHYFVGGWLEYGVLLILLKVWLKVADAEFRFLYRALLISFAWFFLMFQHVKIHPGSGAFAWFSLMLIFSRFLVHFIELVQARIRAGALSGLGFRAQFVAVTLFVLSTYSAGRYFVRPVYMMAGRLLSQL